MLVISVILIFAPIPPSSPSSLPQLITLGMGGYGFLCVRVRACVRVCACARARVCELQLALNLYPSLVCSCTLIHTYKQIVHENNLLFLYPLLNIGHMIVIFVVFPSNLATGQGYLTLLSHHHSGGKTLIAGKETLIRGE